MKSILFTLTVLYALMGFTTGALSFLDAGGVPLMFPWAWKLFGAVALGWWAAGSVGVRLPGGRLLEKPAFDPGTALLFAAAAVFTDFPDRSSAVHLNRSVFALLSASTALLVLLRPTLTARLLSWPLLLGVQIVLAAAFLQTADGRIYWSDDHPSFLYRLILMREHFPNLPSYSPDWNGGSIVREVFATGTMNLFLLGLPFVYWLGDIGTVAGAPVYTKLLTYILCGVIPWSIYIAARMLRLSSASATLAALFAFAPSMAYFEYALRFGTIPFVISAVLTVPGLACLLRIAYDDEPPKLSLVLFTAITCYLGLAWHLMLLAFIPLALLFVRTFKDLRARGRIKPLSVTAFLVLVLSLPSLFVIARESPLLEILLGKSLYGAEEDGMTLVGAQHRTDEKERDDDKPAPAEGRLARIKAGHKDFSLLASKTNVIVLLLAFPALAALPAGRRRQAFAATSLFLLFVAITLDELKPQLELHRFMFVLELLLCTAAGGLLGGVIEGTTRHPQLGRKRLYAATIAALGIGGALTTAHAALDVYQNRSNLKLVFAPAMLSDFVNAVKENGGPGRTFFTGFILHDFGSRAYDTQDGGHIAPLPVFAGKPMFASHYYHLYWATVDPIPETYRKKDDEGIEEFLDLMNVTAVVTFKREWRRYCERSPRYRQVWTDGRFRIFVREARSGGWAMQGSAEVIPDRYGFTVRPQTEETVLRFRWYPRLYSDRPDIAELFPVKVFDEDVGGGKIKPIYFTGIRLKPGALAQSPTLKFRY